MILLIDNYDSFVHNLARYFRRLGHETRVFRNDAVTVADIRKAAPAAVVLSPGPCSPREAGISLAAAHELTGRVPLLGVCLGHQALAAADGAAIVRAPEPFHGRTSQIHHDGRGLFQDLPQPLTVCRYHSLVVDEGTLPQQWRITARTDDGLVMAIEHAEAVAFGVQFHPESILTEHGFALLRNFLRIAGLPAAADVDAYRELMEPAVREIALPQTPVTF